MFCDWVSQIPADENSISETSVTMKAGILKRAMKKPLRRPIRQPTASMTATPAATDQVLPGEEAAALAEQRAPERAAAEEVRVGRRSP